MPTTSRTFRVFVSSTFEDLRAERDALQHNVFPKLRTLCEQHGARFQAIDLRWGVRDEAALDQRTMEICLREIERCQRTGIKPNFIVLLGQRYGWRPLPSRIESREFEAVRARIASEEDRALVDNWYQRDDNAVPPERLLKRRAGEWVESARWQSLEARLHRILLDAARAAGSSDQALVKYWASATHQEILKGLGATLEDRRHLFAFCRQVPDEACDPDLRSLKSLLGAQLPAQNILAYDPGDFARLCKDVERTLRAVIESEAAGFESRPALALEIEAHDTFARERALVFGRDEVLSAIAGYLGTEGDRPLVLHGASGSGKSAVMAQASERARAALPSAVVIRRFIGASPESSRGLRLLRSLAEQIGEAYGTAGELPVEFNGVVHAFRERLGLATSERPLLVFLDALDQFGKDDPARSLSWLGGAQPPYCRVVVSTTDVVPALNECQFLKLEALPQADAATALEHWLGAARRKLEPEQRGRLLDAFARCGLPLYLRLAFEEARGWASYQSSDECLPGDGVEGVIDTLLNRLSREANHGPLLVRRGLGYLAAARYGLTEDEILDMLSADGEVWQDFERRSHHTPPERRLPVIVWSRLYLDLEPYLTERSVPGGTVAAFYHRQVLERVSALYTTPDYHNALAHYFGAQANFAGPIADQSGAAPATSSVNMRKVDELPYQFTHAGQWNDLGQVLTDIRFLYAKCAAGMFFALLDDFTFGLTRYAYVSGDERTPRTEAMFSALHLVQQALLLSAHAVSADSEQLPMQLRGRLLSIDNDFIREFLNTMDESVAFSWLRPRFPGLTQVNGAIRLLWHPYALGASRHLVISRDGATLATIGGESTDYWDVRSGEMLEPLEGSNRFRDIDLTPWQEDPPQSPPFSDSPTEHIWRVSTPENRILAEIEIESRPGQYYANNYRHAWCQTRVTLFRDQRSESLFESPTYFTAISLTHDLRYVIGAEIQGDIFLWDTHDLTLVKRIATRITGIFSVTAFPDLDRVAFMTYAGFVGVASLEEQTIPTAVSAKGREIWITPPVEGILVRGRDDTLQVFDAGTGQILFETGAYGDPTTFYLTSDFRYAFFHGGPMDRYDGMTLTGIDIQNLKRLFQIESQPVISLGVNSLDAVRGALRYVVDEEVPFLCTGGVVRETIDLRTGCLTERPLSSHAQEIPWHSGEQVTPSGRRVAVDPATGIGYVSSSANPPRRIWFSADGNVSGMAISADGSTVAAVSGNEGSLHVFDLLWHDEQFPRRDPCFDLAIQRCALPTRDTNAPPRLHGRHRDAVEQRWKQRDAWRAAQNAENSQPWFDIHEEHGGIDWSATCRKCGHADYFSPAASEKPPCRCPQCGFEKGRV
jgi:WD40 repeat protein